MSIVKENKTIAYHHLEDYKKKTDILPSLYKEILEEANIKTKDIEEIYVVNGPGSFMGIRAGIVFSKTLALASNKKLFSIDNLTFISMGIEGEYFVDAKGKKSYRGIFKNNKIKIDLCEFQEDSKIHYKLLIENPQKFLITFKKIENILDLEELYIKEPQIGGK